MPTWISKKGVLSETQRLQWKLLRNTLTHESSWPLLGFLYTRRAVGCHQGGHSGSGALQLRRDMYLRFPFKLGNGLVGRFSMLCVASTSMAMQCRWSTEITCSCERLSCYTEAFQVCRILSSVLPYVAERRCCDAGGSRNSIIQFSILKHCTAGDAKDISAETQATMIFESTGLFVSLTIVTSELLWPQKIAGQARPHGSSPGSSRFAGKYFNLQRVSTLGLVILPTQREWLRNFVWNCQRLSTWVLSCAVPAVSCLCLAARPFQFFMIKNCESAEWLNHDLLTQLPSHLFVQNLQFQFAWWSPPHAFWMRNSFDQAELAPIQFQ